jgi:Na+-transporting methylmalonyl-CoA/oxaloacetate decarboxylase gamma subunit
MEEILYFCCSSWFFFLFVCLLVCFIYLFIYFVERKLYVFKERKKKDVLKKLIRERNEK